MTENLVTVATFDTQFDAGFAQARLEEAGIESFLQDTETISVAWHLAQALGGIKLQVLAADAERARSIIAQARSADRAHKSSDPNRDLAERAFRAAAVGVFFAPLQLYSIWLLIRLRWGFDPQRTSRAIRRRVIQASLLNLWVVGLIAFMFLVIRSS